MSLVRAFLVVGLAVCALTAPGSSGAQSLLSEVVEDWLASPHADRSASAFTHWNEDGAVAPECANCHSSAGFIDFVGGDGSIVGMVDHPVATGLAIDCTGCHNRAAEALSDVTFPSGVVVGGLGTSAPCMVCHQGRHSGPTLAALLEGLDPDVVAADLGFANIHYRAAAASLLGAEVHGAYEYPGQSYAGRFAHVPDFADCTGCHDPHRLTVATDGCAACHGPAEVTAIRMSPLDADGDGDTKEGVAAEIATLHDALGHAIATYAAEVAGTAIVYAPDAYPYFFADTDGDGQAAAAEMAYPNRYQSWTPRLLKAAYNYQFVAKEPGIHAHNPRYAQQILIDSLDDLAKAVPAIAGSYARP